MAFKLRSAKTNETDIQSQIIDYLRLELLKGRIVWFARCNGGGTFDRTGRWFWFYRLFLRNRAPASKGMADLHGQLHDGRYFALEVKAPGERPTEAQAHFLETVRMGKGIAGVVRSYADAKNIIFDEFDLKREENDQ